MPAQQICDKCFNEECYCRECRGMYNGCGENGEIKDFCMFDENDISMNHIYFMYDIRHLSMRDNCFNQLTTA
jgi:hypothetical protein